MASNYRRKPPSPSPRRASGLPRSAPAPAGRGGGGSRGSLRSPDRGAPPRAAGSYRAFAGGQPPKRRGGSARPALTSVRLGDLDRTERSSRAHGSYRRYFRRALIAAVAVAVLIVGGAAAYSSNLFAIDSVSVTGVEHLTASDMTELASVPANTTLLRVNAGGIRDRLLKDAWVKDVSVNRVFPHTLELAVTERSIAAVVDVPTEKADSTQQWAIASDGTWLMPIPPKDSDQGKKTSPKVYEDAAKVLAITDVPYGTKPVVGAYCTDPSVKNALAIVAGMTTELSGQVKKVAATETESTTLTLDSGVEIVFGDADHIRDKERVCLEIMKEHPDGVSYINVRVVDRPTWRAL